MCNKNQKQLLLRLKKSKQIHGMWIRISVNPIYIVSIKRKHLIIILHLKGTNMISALKIQLKKKIFKHYRIEES
jgi:hypothetical protein